MHKEIEIKFLDIDHQRMRQTLKEKGAALIYPMRDFRRVVIDVDDPSVEYKGDAHVRVRDEGDKVTMTFKRYNSLTLHGVEELETTVGDFETAVAILKAIGHEVKSYQESRREKWQLGECEIVLDEWPWLKPYMEVEGPNETVLRDTVKELGLAWDEGVFGSVTVAYRAEYDIPRSVAIGDFPEVKFDLPIPNDLAKLKR